MSKRAVGSVWRIQAVGARGGTVAASGDGGDTVFDELVIAGVLHLEQLDARTWWLGVGQGADMKHLTITVGRDGKVRLGGADWPGDKAGK